MMGKISKILKVIFLSFLILLVLPVFFQNSASARKNGRPAFVPLKKPVRQDVSETELEKVERLLKREKKQHIVLKEKAENLKQELADVKTKMVKAAKKVQQHEKDLSRLEERLSELEEKQFVLSGDLKHRDLQMVQVLSVLENLALKPTEALVAQPLSPVETVRSAILLRAAVPQIEKSAVVLRKDLNHLTRIKTAVRSQYARIAVVAKNLESEHKGLKSLFQKKRSIRRRIEKQSVQASKRAKNLAEQASDLRDLLAKLEAERIRQEKIRKKKEAELRKKRLKNLSKKVAKRPSNVAKRKRSYGSFAKAKGTLPYPVIGRIVKKYGAKTKTGGHEKGITLATRKGAQVIAPFDGKVLFSGPFRRYGQLLIIQHGDGYHTLLAGMNQIDVEVGQSLLAGEPVGLMGDKKDTKLYIEFRRNSQPINPTPWLAKIKGKKTG